MGTEMVTGCVGQGDAAFFIQLRCAMEYIFFFFSPLNCKADQAVLSHELLYHSLLWISLGVIL